MLVPFRTEHGTLYIRAEDLRSIRDTGNGTLITWDEAGRSFEDAVLGTADEVFAALAREERKRAEEHAQLQQRAQAGLPITPVGRGRQR